MNSSVEKIYGATIKVLSEEGVEACSLSKIRDTSKLAIGTIYYYFKNKEDILNSLYLELIKELVEATDFSVEKKDYKKTFDKVMGQMLSYDMDNDAKSKVRFALMLSNFITDESMDRMYVLLDQMKQLLAKGVVAGMVEDTNKKTLINQCLWQLAFINNQLEQAGKKRTVNISNSGLNFLWKAVKVD